VNTISVAVNKGMSAELLCRTCSFSYLIDFNSALGTRLDTGTKIQFFSCKDETVDLRPVSGQKKPQDS
jgi:hypothetical protein